MPRNTNTGATGSKPRRLTTRADNRENEAGDMSYLPDLIGYSPLRTPREKKSERSNPLNSREQRTPRSTPLHRSPRLSCISNRTRYSLVDFDEEDGPIIMNLTPVNKKTPCSALTPRSSTPCTPVARTPRARSLKNSVTGRMSQQGKETAEAPDYDAAMLKTPVNQKTTRYNMQTPPALNILDIFPDGVPPAPRIDYTVPPTETSWGTLRNFPPPLPANYYQPPLPTNYYQHPFHDDNFDVWWDDQGDRHKLSWNADRRRGDLIKYFFLSERNQQKKHKEKNWKTQHFPASCLC